MKLFTLQTLVMLCISIAAASCQTETAPAKRKETKPITTTEFKASMTPLKDQLEAKKATYAVSWDKATQALHAGGIEKVINDGITASAKQVGDQAPDFTLNNHDHLPVKLSDALKEGPVVLTWYRGGWCPYCNITLRALQDVLPEIKAEGATLFALTPEVPDQSLSTAEKNELDFVVLSDLQNKVAHSYGVVFKLEEKVADAYQAGFDLHSYNGDDSDELPLAATYVIGQDGTIKYAFLDADYRNRAEPSDIVAELKKL